MESENKLSDEIEKQRAKQTITSIENWAELIQIIINQTTIINLFDRLENSQNQDSSEDIDKLEPKKEKPVKPKFTKEMLAESKFKLGSANGWLSGKAVITKSEEPET